MTTHMETPAKPRSRHAAAIAIVVLSVAIALLLLWNLGALRSRPKLALVTSGEGPYWDQVIDGAKKAADICDADLTVVKSRTDVATQTQLIHELMQRKWDGVAVSPINPMGQAGVLMEVAAATTLVTFDSDSPVSKRLCFVGTDNYAAGRLAGERARMAVPGGGDVVIVIGNLDKENTQRRRQGAIDELLERPFNPDQTMDPTEGVLKGPQYNVVATIVDGSDAAKATELAAAAIKTNPNIKCFIGMLSYTTPALLKALEQTQNLGKIQLIGFDANDQTLAGIENGYVSAAVMQDQFGCGYHTVRILAENARGDTSGLPIFQRRTLPCELITKENVSSVRTQLASPGSAAPTTQQ